MFLKMTQNDDNIPLNIVRRNLHRREVIKRANIQMKLDNIENIHVQTVKVTSMITEHSYEDWKKKCLDYTKKNNRKYVMICDKLLK
jgi:hypothetical protein